MLHSTNQHLNQTHQHHHQSQHCHNLSENHHNATRQRRNYLLSLIEGGLPVLLVLLLFLAECPSTSSFVVPNELPSILSLVYSNIPPIKKGTDSRLGFGFRLGEQADFQILLELGPQKETRPIGDQDSDGSSFNKRQVNKSQQRAVQREVAKTNKTPSTWLEKWSSQANNVSRKKVAPKDIPTKKPVVHKPTAVIQMMPPLPQQMPNQALQQLQMLYKMATTTERNVAAIPDATTASPSIVDRTTTTIGPLTAAAAYHLQERLKLLQAPANVEELQAIMEKSQAQKKAEITKELMDVSLDE